MYYLYNQVHNSTVQNEQLRNQVTVLQSQLPDQQEAIAGLKDEIAQLEPTIEPFELEVRAFSTTFTNMEETRSMVDADSSAVVKALPSAGVDLISVNHTIDQVSVNGIATDETGIFEYARALRSGGRFSLVVISAIQAENEIIPAEEEGGVDQEITQFNFQFTLLK